MTKLPEISVDEYLSFYKSSKTDRTHMENEKWFLETFPKQILGICPFCGKPNQVRLDLCTLANWYGERRGHNGIPGVYPGFKYALDSDFLNICKHLYINDIFMNFQGNYPRNKEIESFFWGKYDKWVAVPAIMIKLMNLQRSNQIIFSREDHSNYKIFTYSRYLEGRSGTFEPVGIKAVITDFPVHQIMGDRFEPKFRVYIISYFFPEGYEIPPNLNSNASEWALFYFSGNENDWDWSNRFSDELDFDLKKYVKSNQLFWYKDGKQYSKSDSKGCKFPYERIKGKTWPSKMPQWFPPPTP